MNIRAKIKSTATGEVRETEHEYPQGNLEGILFHWTEGNYGCDCNRELFYLQAAGELDEDKLDETECTEGRYQVQVFAGDTLLLDEFTP